jgi:hypothetical protein
MLPKAVKDFINTVRSLGKAWDYNCVIPWSIIQIENRAVFPYINASKYGAVDIQKSSYTISIFGMIVSYIVCS